MQNKRIKRTRIKLRSHTTRPRLSVFVSNKHIFAQVIDDLTGSTLASARDVDVKAGKTTDVSRRVGELLAKKAGEKGVKQVVLDRGGRKYHGRVKALAEGAREGGLEF